MSKFQISIDLENVDLASLDTEEDFREEAKRLLTKTLIKLPDSLHLPGKVTSILFECAAAADQTTYQTF